MNDNKSTRNLNSASEQEFILIQDELVRAAPISSSSSEQYARSAFHVREIMKLTNLDLVYVFKKPISEKGVDRLKLSLSEVLGHYPTLSGRIEGVKVRLNNEGAAFRVQRDTAASTTKRSSIHDIPREPATGPPYCYIPAPAAQTQGTAPLLTVTVTQFQDGWTLGVVMNHLIVDAWTFAMFMQDWSTLFNNKNSAVALEPIIYQLPDVVTERYPAQDEADKAAIELFGAVKSSAGKRMLLKTIFRWILPMMMKKDPRIGVTPDRMLLHYSEKQVRQLKAQAEAIAGTWVSTNEALLAHVWQVLLDAAKLDSNQRSCIGAAFPVDLRTKLPGLPPRVAGNVVTVTEIVMDMNNTVTSDGPLEKRLHDAMRSSLKVEKLIAANRISNATWLEDGNFVTYENKEAGDLKYGGLRGCIQWNWQVTNPYYDIDFGSGRPLRGIFWGWNQPVTALPCPEGGVDVYIDKTSRGPVSWLQVPGSKWSTIRNVLGIAAISGSLALSTLCVGRSSSLMWLVSLGILSLAASSYVQGGADAHKRNFHEYVEANAHRSLN